MKQTANNTFQDGMNLDLHPMVTPNSVLTDNLNGTFITYNGNEFCLQNDKGNTVKAFLTPGFVPIGIKEHNGVLYIISYKEKTGESEIGTYPGLDWDKRTGNLDYTKYTPLKNFLDSEDNKTEFRTSLLRCDAEHPVTIEVQDSYDGSVNLILVDDKNPPRIINSAFSITEDSTYELISRNQNETTNTYRNGTFDIETSLILTTNVVTNIELSSVDNGGQLKGGNYTFYLKFGDDDYNQTDIVAESGIISIFNGTDGKATTISGTLADERTNKLVWLEVTGLNHAYSNLYIYYNREYSDTNGYRMTEAGMLSEPIKMTNGDTQKICINGYEQVTNISIEDLNIDYHTIDYVKTEVQQQNMLFLGNVGQKETYQLYKKLKNITLNVTTTLKQDEEGLNKVSSDYTQGDEYYSTQNIYSRLGYWPDEIYRFGIVYILNDGSTTPVFNMCGGTFNEIGESINKEGEFDESDFATHNKYGVFLTPRADVITSTDKVKPLYFSFQLPALTEVSDEVIGWFVVRQKRIPRTICQGLTIGIDEQSHLPMIWNGQKWFIESFLSLDRTNKERQQELLNEIKKYEDLEKAWWKTLIAVFAAPLIGYVWHPYRLYTATAFAITSNVTAKKKLAELRDSIESGQKPMLYYYSGKFKEYDTEYFAIRVEAQNESGQIYYNGKYNDYGAWYEHYKTDPRKESGKVILVDNVEAVTGTDVYEYRYQIYSNIHGAQDTYIYIVSNDEDYLSDVTVQYLDENRRLMLFTSLESIVEFAFGVDHDKLYSKVRELNTFIRTCAEKTTRYIYEDSSSISGNGLLSLDPCVNNTISTMFNGTDFYMRKEYDVKCAFGTEQENPGNQYFNDTYLKVDHEGYTFDRDADYKEHQCVYIKQNTNTKVVNTYVFSNTAGNASDISDLKYTTDAYYKNINSGVMTYDIRSDNRYQNCNAVRGIFCPYIGVTTKDLVKESIYSVRVKETTSIHDLFSLRASDNSPYYCISKHISTDNNTFDVYGGDCYTNTVTFRVLRNFIDGDSPYTETIISEDGWVKMLEALEKYEDGDEKFPSIEAVLDEVNVSDVNTVDLGYWVTFKCLSSYNLGLRSENAFNIQEMALLGSSRSFYPLTGLSTATGTKIEESFLLNDGLSATVGGKRYTLLPDTPYYNSEFATRILFSNKNVTKAFANGYRVFQGLSYQDYDKQYGPIVKLESWGNNILCVFEHGVAMLPVNEKALMQTTTEQTIHIYGHGVLPDQMSIISQDYGSRYANSVIRTPIGIYGVDTDAKKIWRFSDKQGFETLSDMKIESFLNNNLDSLYDITMSVCDIRTHYNSKKGDVIFTWYKPGTKSQKAQYCAICFNERQSIWTTRYDWLPIVSENINGEFYSLQDGADENIVDNQVVGGVGIYSHNPVEAEPTKWYGKQHPFEFEFVVSDPIGAHKIYENLQIISNNVQPEELQFEFIGDSYMFNKERIYHSTKLGTFDGDRVLKANYSNESTIENPNITDESSDAFRIPSKTGIIRQQDEDGYRPFRNASVLKDRDYAPNIGRIEKTQNATNQYHLVIPQECRNIESWGRRLGNMHYKADSWYTNIEPILYDARLNDPNWTKFVGNVQKWNSARIRDKWCKIRVRYSGEDLAVITAIKTILNI